MIKQGEIFVFTMGEYDDYCHIYHGRARRDFDPTWMRDKFIHEYNSHSFVDFIAWFVKQDVADRLELPTFHLGNYHLGDDGDD